MHRGYPGISHLVISRLSWMLAVDQITGTKNGVHIKEVKVCALGSNDTGNSTVVAHLDSFKTGVVRPANQARHDHLRVRPGCLDLGEQTLQGSLHLSRCPALARIIRSDVQKDKVRKDQAFLGNPAIEPMPAIAIIGHRVGRNQSGKIALDLVDTIAGMAFMIMLSTVNERWRRVICS